jgi:hypothetical protein
MRKTKDQALLEKLPESLRDDPFWKTSHTKRPTTFGCEPRRFRDLSVEDRYKVEKDAEDWVMLDKDRANHGRLQISTRWGTLSNSAPSCDTYNPKYELQSFRENGPLITIAHKQSSDKEFFEALEFTKTIRQDPSYKRLMKSSSSKNEKSKDSKPPSKKLDKHLQNLNLDDMRKGKAVCTFLLMFADSSVLGLLPAPGSYNLDLENDFKFERSSIMRISESKANPRARLDFESLQTISKDSRLCNGSYVPDSNPVMKCYPSFSIGCKRPILNQRGTLSVSFLDSDVDFSFS